MASSLNVNSYIQVCHKALLVPLATSFSIYVSAFTDSLSNTAYLLANNTSLFCPVLDNDTNRFVCCVNYDSKKLHERTKYA